MIESAAILAAGQGTRLGPLAEGMPKGFLTLGGRPIIEESIEKLIDCGVSRIVIGTGFGARHYEQLADRYPQVQCLENPEFANSGSMHTLYRLRALLPDRFLLLESDLIYERAALEALIDTDEQNVILASGFTGAGDEVYIETDRASNLVAMSKDRSTLAHADGELVGVSRISPRAYAAMCGFAEEQFARTLALDYEDALVAIAASEDVRVLKIDGLAWTEIDDKMHLRRAREVVYPEILRREASR